jgi:hypothetical protein
MQLLSLALLIATSLGQLTCAAGGNPTFVILSDRRRFAFETLFREQPMPMQPVQPFRRLEILHICNASVLAGQPFTIVSLTTARVMLPSIQQKHK